mmetsp:Transcript_46007/g.59103  ORF Transcript_46007/g.59103 Transcript_46007/m.59103 type:complete len:112 (-) Transcript_46007:70-405(-)
MCQHDIDDLQTFSHPSTSTSTSTLVDDNMDMVILSNQGWLNSKRILNKIVLKDLGLLYNWVGSFNGSNSFSKPCEAYEAYGVHATTGLPNFGQNRVEFISYVDDMWNSLGL